MLSITDKMKVMPTPLHIGPAIACSLAALLLLADPAAAQTTRPTAGDDLTVPEARQKVEAIAEGIRGEWALRGEVIDAEAELARARRDFRAEHRRVLLRLRQENPEYPELLDEVIAQRQALHRLRRDRLTAPPRAAEEATRRGDGNVVGRVGATGRQRGRIMGENTNSGDARLTPREQGELRAIVREAESSPARPSAPSTAEQKAAARLLDLHERIEAIEEAAILADDLASEMKAVLARATGQWQALEEALAEEILNDPDFQAARQALAEARERAAANAK